MRLTLPYPPTANLYWRHNRGRIHRSKEADAYIARVRWLALAAKVKPLEGPVVVSVSLFRPAKRGDLDNSLKVLLDALRKVVFVDDSQVEQLHAMRAEDKANPRAEVTVEAVG